MAAFVKSIAPLQILGVGDEGFATSLNDQDSSTLVAANPGAASRKSHHKQSLTVLVCRR